MFFDPRIVSASMRRLRIPALPLPRVVNGAAAGRELLEHGARFVSQHAVAHGDATPGELGGPGGMDGALVEASDALEIGAAARDHQRAHAGPEHGAAAHRARAPVDDQLVRRLAWAAQVVRAGGAL